MGEQDVIPDPTAEDHYELDMIHYNQTGLAWIRRCVAAEKRVAELEEYCDRFKAAIRFLVSVQ